MDNRGNNWGTSEKGLRFVREWRYLRKPYGDWNPKLTQSHSCINLFPYNIFQRLPEGLKACPSSTAEEQEGAMGPEDNAEIGGAVRGR